MDEKAPAAGAPPSPDGDFRRPAEAPDAAVPRMAYDPGDEFGLRLAEAFVARGVVVVEGVFAAEECDSAMGEIVEAFERLSPRLRRAPLAWRREDGPPQTRAGLYQAVVGNLAPVWRIRADPRVGRIFEALYSALRGRRVVDFVASGDGINLKPGLVGPYGAARDWAHLDQTYGGPFRCVQGQAVLTTTTAALRASPGSHRAFGRILAATGGVAAGDWRRFTPEQAGVAARLVGEAGGAWQVPVRAPRGSFIVWALSVVHSATYQAGPEAPTATEPWRGWRGVVYVCYRPRAEFTEQQLRCRRKAFEGNRVTNHWGTRIFPANPAGRYGPPSPALTRADGQNYVDTPALVYELLGRPALAPGRERRLAGYDDAPGSA